MRCQNITRQWHIRTKHQPKHIKGEIKPCNDIHTLTCIHTFPSRFYVGSVASIMLHPHISVMRWTIPPTSFRLDNQTNCIQHNAGKNFAIKSFLRMYEGWKVSSHFTPFNIPFHSDTLVVTVFVLFYVCYVDLVGLYIVCPTIQQQKTSKSTHCTHAIHI